MNEKIDLTKILKDCPRGWKFYSSVSGVVVFLEVLDNAQDIQRLKYPIKLMEDSGKNYYVSREGRHRYRLGECTLFPSEDQRDWSKFTAPWYKKEKFDPKTLNPFDKVLVKDRYSQCWRCNLFSHIETEYPMFRVNTILVGHFYYCIPYNEDTKHLVGTTEEAPEFYRYWED